MELNPPQNIFKVIQTFTQVRRISQDPPKQSLLSNHNAIILHILASFILGGSSVLRLPTGTTQSRESIQPLDATATLRVRPSP